MTKEIDHESSDADDEISLVEIVQFFVDNLGVFIKSTLACGALGVAYAFLAPAQYEATMNIQMAMVANNPVETPAVLLEKMKLPLYFSEETWDKCDTDEDLTPSRTLAKKLNPMLNKQAPFIGLAFRSNSTADSQACLLAVLKDIRHKQDLLSAPIVEQKQSYLQTLKAKLATAEQVSQYLSEQKRDFKFKDERFSANALILATSLNNGKEISDLRNAITELEISLSPPQTQGTYLAAPVYASQQPVAPKKLLVIALALLTGVFAALLFLLGRTAWKKIKPQLKY